MSNPKEDIYAKFYPFLDTHVGFWRGRRVIPYSRAYADAYAAFVQTREEAEKDRARRMDLYIAVGMLAGVVVCGLGPVSGMIAAGKRSVRVANVALARAAGRIGMANRAAAWTLMTKFTFGGVPQIATAVWGSQGKDILKNHLSKFTGGVATIGQAAAAVQNPLRNDIKRDKMPIEYFLELDGLLLKAKNAITGCAMDLIKEPSVSTEEFQQYCDNTRKSNLFTKSPKMDLSGEQMTRLANEMEMALWAFSACTWKETRHREKSTINRSGDSGGPYTHYSIYLEEDRVLERIDKVAKNLRMKNYYCAEYKESKNNQGQTVLRSHKTSIATKSWDDHFGFLHSPSEKELLIKWAKTYVIEKANKTVMPLEFK